MKIGIVSDSHSLVRELNDLQKRHEKEVSMWIHCGDSELEKTQLESFHVVKVKKSMLKSFVLDIRMWQWQNL